MKEQFEAFREALDVFVLGGWAHSFTREADANHLYPLTKKAKKILLCSAPGGEIKETRFSKALIAKCDQEKLTEKYDQDKLHYFQPCTELIGMPLLKGFSIESPHSLLTLDYQDLMNSEAITLDEESRLGWLAHLGQHKERLLPYLKETAEGELKQDKLIVIYASKDEPDENTKNRLNALENKEDYFVVIIVADVEKGQNNKEWKDLASKLFKSWAFIPPTPSTDILMRGLQDAEYAMATGVWTILEVMILYDIKHCSYMPPPHIENKLFCKIVSSADSLQHHIEQGKESIAILSQFLKGNAQSLQAFPTNVLLGQEDTAEEPLHVGIEQQKNLKKELLTVKSEAQAFTNPPSDNENEEESKGPKPGQPSG